MSDPAKLVVGVLVLLIAIWLVGQIFTYALGYFFIALIVGIIIALTVALVRAWGRPKSGLLDVLPDKAHKAAAKQLEQIQRKTDADRLKH